MVSELSVAQLPVLPQFQKRERCDSGTNDEMPVPQYASVGEAKDEWRRYQPQTARGFEALMAKSDLIYVKARASRPVRSLLDFCLGRAST